MLSALGTRVLFTSEFDDDWIPRSLRIIARYSSHYDLKPLVLLPHDIQLEDYEPFFEVMVARAAERALADLLDEECDGEPRLVVIDLAPEPYLDDFSEWPSFHRALRDGVPAHSMLVVESPETEYLSAEQFDEHLFLRSRAAVR